MAECIVHTSREQRRLCPFTAGLDRVQASVANHQFRLTLHQIQAVIGVVTVLDLCAGLVAYKFGVGGSRERAGNP